MSGEIVVVGSSNTDMIVRVPRLPGAGETVIGGRFARAAGGKGANQAVAAARAGAHVRLVASVGDDDLGAAARTGLEAEGIDVGGLVTASGTASGVAFIVVDEAGENAIAVASGANAALRPAHVEAERAAIEAADVLVVQLETPLDTVAAAIDVAHGAGVQVVLDPAPAQTLPGELLARVDVLTPNVTEATQLTGLAIDDVETAGRAAQSLRAQGARRVVVTLGAEGALWVDADSALHVEGQGVDCVDSTGAGDVFAGCLAASLARGDARSDALAFANAGAAISVTREGAQPAAPTGAEIEARIATMATPPSAAGDRR